MEAQNDMFCTYLIQQILILFIFSIYMIYQNQQLWCKTRMYLHLQNFQYFPHLQHHLSQILLQFQLQLVHYFRKRLYQQSLFHPVSESTLDVLFIYITVLKLIPKQWCIHQAMRQKKYAREGDTKIFTRIIPYHHVLVALLRMQVHK